MAMSRPRILRSSSIGTRNKFLSPQWICPLTFAPSGNKPKTDNAVKDLPDPDSPTIATLAPGRTSRFSPSTTLRSLRPSPNWMVNWVIFKCSFTWIPFF